MTPSLNHTVETAKEKDSHHQSVIELIKKEQWTKVKRRVSRSPEQIQSKLTLNIDGQNTCAYPLHYLCRKKEAPVDLVETFVIVCKEATCTPDSVLGELPIHVACQHDFPVPSLQVLVNAYPDGLVTPDNDGNLAIHYACSLESSDSVRYLIKACPESVSKTNQKAQTPLHLECSRYEVSLSMVQELLQVDESACGTRDWQGRLPIHSASMWKADTAVVALLLETYPESVRVRDSHHMTPYDILRKLVHLPATHPTVELLRDYRRKHGDFFMRSQEMVKYQAENLSDKLGFHPQRQFYGVHGE